MLKPLIMFLQFFLLLHLSNVLVGIDRGEEWGLWQPWAAESKEKQNEQQNEYFMERNLILCAQQFLKYWEK